jgi:hypothetical protein
VENFKIAFNILFIKNSGWKLNNIVVDDETLFNWFVKIISEHIVNNVVVDDEKLFNWSLKIISEHIVNIEECTNVLKNQKEEYTSVFKNENIDIIGLHGSAECGKDTFAGHTFFNDHVKLSFAKPIKDVCQILFGFTDEQLYNEKYKNVVIPHLLLNGEPASPRKVLQWLGTDILRKYISENFFIEHMDKRIRNYLKTGVSKYIITDIRFPNEAMYIKKFKKGIVIYISRPNHSNGLDNQSKQHIS